MHARKPANSFAASTCLKSGNVLSKFFFFHRFLNLMSFSSDLVFSTRVNGVVFWPHLGTVIAKFQDLLRALPPGPPPELCSGPDKTQLKIPL